MEIKGKFSAVVLLLQVLFIVIYSIFVDYGEDLDATSPQNYYVDPSKPKKNVLGNYYSMFQDTNALVFIGVGFLYTFIRKYGYSGVGMNMLLAGISIQWALLCHNWWAATDGMIHIDVVSLITAEFAAVSTVIALGAVFGKISPLQMVIFSLLEVLIYTTNEHFSLKGLHVSDVGGSVSLHMFCGIFGCAAAYAVDRKMNVQNNPNEGCSYESNLFCMIGTVLLWCFWPSFNASLTTGDEQYRVVMNTFLALLGSILTAFAMSAIIHKDKKFTMGHIQNATLAGGVAIGTTCNLMILPYGALLIGSIGGVLCVLGFMYIGPFLAVMKAYDPCAINSLHAFPGFFSGMTGIFAALMANEERYGHNLYTIYPAMAPLYNSTALLNIQKYSPGIQAGLGRTSAMQACFQLVYLVQTVLVAILTGILTGSFLRFKIFDPLDDKQMYLDDPFFVVPESKEKKNSIPNLSCDSKI